MLLPQPLRPEHGAVMSGDDTAGWMYTRGHKFEKDSPSKDPEDFVACLTANSCTVAVVFDGHGGSAVCARACAPIMIQMATERSPNLCKASTCAFSLELVILALPTEAFAPFAIVLWCEFNQDAILT